MKLVPVHDEPRAADILYELLAERPLANRISHEKMPSLEEHRAFVQSHPFRLWLLIQEWDHYVGAIEVTYRNEIGISIFKLFQRQRCASRALGIFMMEYPSLPAIPAIRNGRWLANIAVGNEASKAFFAHLKFRPLQETYVL